MRAAPGEKTKKPNGDIPVTEHQGNQQTSEAVASTSSGGMEDETKKEIKRSVKACLPCRKLKMRCYQDDEDPYGRPCRRCKNGGYDCVFQLVSMRGRRTNPKTDMMARTLQNMEATLNTVLNSIAPSASAVAPRPSTSSPLHPNPTVLPIPTLNPLVPTPLAIVESPDGASSVVSSLKFGQERSDGGSEIVIRELPNNAGTDDGGSPRVVMAADSMNPLGLLAEASLGRHPKRARAFHEGEATGEHDEPAPKLRKLGVANTSYFEPGLDFLPHQRAGVQDARQPLALLEEKVLTADEVVDLWNLYFSRCHAVCPILDAELHTPTATASRSPFLFTSICTVASRYYTKRTDDLHRRCLAIAKKTAFEVLVKGFKSPEICQAFFLLCQWNTPAERFEQDRVYQFSGIAIRMAADLHLNRKSAATLPPGVGEDVQASYEREISNRERLWMYSYVFDRSIACQSGKMTCIPYEDSILRSARTWCSQKTSQFTDLGISAIVEIHRIISPLLESLHSDRQPSSIGSKTTTLAHPILLRSFLNQLDQWNIDWTVQNPQDPVDFATGDRSCMRMFYHSYYRLFVLSFAVQHALETESLELARYCAKSFESASKIIVLVKDYLEPSGYFRFASDFSIIFLSYACCYLLKLVSPTFAAFVDTESALEMVEQGVTALESAAVDDAHTPALYATFIRGLLDQKRNGDASVVQSRMQTRASSPALPISENVVQSSYEDYFGGLFGETSDVSGNKGAADAFDSMDLMLDESFWSNMLMPGFAPGPLQNVSGAGGAGFADAWASFSPLPTRSGSPVAHDFGFRP